MDRFCRRSGIRNCLSGLMMSAAVVAMLANGPAYAADVMPSGFAGLPALSDAELKELRGGFVLANGLELRFALEFVFQFETNAPIVNTFTEADFLRPDGVSLPSGVVNHIVNDTVSVRLTSDVTGVMNIVQNNLNGVHLQNATTLSLDLFNMNAAIQNLNGALDMSLDTRALIGY